MQKNIEEIVKLNLKFIWKCRRPKITKKFLKKETKFEGPSLPDFKTHYKERQCGTSVIIDR